MNAVNLWDIPTQPTVHCDELPSCRGACRQGRDVCIHPLVCSGIEAPSMRTDLHRVELANGQTITVPKHRTPTGERWHELGWTVSVIAASVGSVFVLVAMGMGWL